MDQAPQYQNPPVQTAPQYQPTVQPKKPGGSIISFLAIVGLIALVASAFAGGIFFSKFSNIKIDENIKILGKVTPTLRPPDSAYTTEPAESSKSKRIIYELSSDIILSDVEGTKTTNLTNNIPPKKSMLPRWVDANTISYVTYSPSSSDQNAPVTATLVVKSLKDNSEKVVLTRKSTPNSNGYPMAYEIKTYSWDKSGTKLAYIANDIQKGPELLALSSFHILDIKTNSDVTASTQNDTGGRGGTYDDEIAVTFSPDGTKVIFTDTSVYPPFKGSVDNGTLFVVDAANGNTIFSKSQTWLTFGRWKDNTTVIAKVNDYKNGYISEISLPTKELIKINEAPGWFNIQLVKDEILYSKLNPGQGTGVSVHKYSLTTKQDEVLRNSAMTLWMPFSGGTNTPYIIQIMGPCDNNDCGMDMFNGVQYKSLGLWDPAKGNEITSLNIPKLSNSPQLSP